MTEIKVNGRRGGLLHLEPVEDGENPRGDMALWIEQDGQTTTVHTTLDAVEQAIAEYRVLHLATAPTTRGTDDSE